MASHSAGGDRGADPGGAQGALALARADIGADHGDERTAQAEDQRDQQVFEPRAGAVAGDRRRAELRRRDRSRWRW